MKTRFVTLITLAAIILSISVAKAETRNTANNNSSTPVTVAINNITKIEASGNVEVYITSGDKDGVEVYDKYYSKNALVQGKDGVLRVSSYTNEKLVVLVTVTNLREIVANDNATVKSYGRLSVIDLNVVLNNNALAQLKLDAFAASFTLNNRAKADLAGNIHEYTMNYSQSSTINKTELTATISTEKNTTQEAARRLSAATMASL